MKKLRLNKIFHWLYACLMFLPFISVVLSVVANFGLGGSGFTSEQLCFSLYSTGLSGADGGTIGSSIDNVFTYLFQDIFGFTDGEGILANLSGLFTYWVVVSLGYLIFDVLMYPINLFHRWIDDGGF